MSENEMSSTGPSMHLQDPSSNGGPAHPSSALPAHIAFAQAAAALPSPIPPAERAIDDKILLFKRLFSAFLHLWGKVPRSMRPEKENQEPYLLVKTWFMNELGALATKKAELAKRRLEGGGSPDAEDEVPAGLTPIRTAARACRALNDVEWEMLKAQIDISMKFDPEDVLLIMDDLRDTHCVDCGEWLDEADPHNECSAHAKPAGEIMPNAVDVDGAPPDAPDLAAAPPVSSAPVPSSTTTSSL